MNQQELDKRNANIDDEIEVYCGKCAIRMILDKKDIRTARAFDCTSYGHKTRVYVEFKKN